MPKALVVIGLLAILRGALIHPGSGHGSPGEWIGPGIICLLLALVVMLVQDAQKR